MNSFRIKLLILAILLLVAIGVAFVMIKQPHTVPLPKPVAIDIAQQPMLGNVAAKVTIVAFEDLKCSNCMRFNETIFPLIEKKYIKTKIAKYVFINLAFIPGSLPAAMAARCIYDQNHQAFFDYVSYIYAHQPPEEQDWATLPNLMLFANHLTSIDSNQLAACLVKSPYTELFNNNLTLAAKIMGPDVSTPTLYINGIKVDPLTWAHIQEMMEQLDS